MRTFAHALCVSCVLLTFACGGDPADIAGEYSVSLTNRENGCELDNWTEGDTAANIPLVITQDGTEAEATVEGVAGGVLNFWLGSNVFVGEVDGDEFDLTLFGQNSFSAGNCSFTFNAEISGSSDGDLIAGDLRYRAATNNNPDCADLEGCVTRSEFNGTRPPQ